MNIDSRPEFSNQNPNRENPMQRLGHLLKEARFSVGASRTFLTILMAPTGAVATTTIIDSLAPHTSIVAVASAEPNLAELCRNVVVKGFVLNFTEKNGKVGYQEAEDEAGAPIKDAKVQPKVNGENQGAILTTDDRGLFENRFDAQTCNADNGTKLISQYDITTPDGRTALRTVIVANGITGSRNIFMEEGTVPTATATSTVPAGATSTPVAGSLSTPSATRTPERTGTATSTPTVTKTPEKTGTTTPTPTTTRTPERTATPTVTATVTATSIVEPSPTPASGGGFSLPDFSGIGEAIGQSPVGVVLDLPAKGVDQFTDPDTELPIRAGVDVLGWLLLLGRGRLGMPRTAVYRTGRYPFRLIRAGFTHIRARN